MDQPNQADIDISDVVIDYGTTFEHAVIIHRFLLVELLAEIEKRGPVDAEKSLTEIKRVCEHEAAIIALKNGCLIGTMGIIKPKWWFGHGEFLTDRWTAILPEFQHAGVRELMLDQVKRIADDNGLKFVNQGKIRDMKDGTALLFPRLYTPPSDLHDTPTLGSA